MLRKNLKRPAGRKMHLQAAGKFVILTRCGAITGPDGCSFRKAKVTCRRCRRIGGLDTAPVRPDYDLGRARLDAKPKARVASRA
jgi:hypothetical protein